MSKREDFSIAAGLPTGRRAALRLVACGGLLLSCLGVFGADTAREYQIKAAFLYNFTKFVEWPSGRFATEDEPITIGVLGKNPFGEKLESTIRGRKVGGRDLVVVSVTPEEKYPPFHLLFVPAGEEKFFNSDLAAAALTIGESERFRALGGMITFYSDAEKVRFMINLEKAEKAQVKLSAQLLKLASSVRRGAKE